jgi:hypothetical protein
MSEENKIPEHTWSYGIGTTLNNPWSEILPKVHQETTPDGDEVSSIKIYEPFRQSIMENNTPITNHKYFFKSVQYFIDDTEPTHPMFTFNVNGNLIREPRFTINGQTVVREVRFQQLVERTKLLEALIDTQRKIIHDLGKNVDELMIFKDYYFQKNPPLLPTPIVDNLSPIKEKNPWEDYQFQKNHPVLFDGRAFSAADTDPKCICSICSGSADSLALSSK